MKIDVDARNLNCPIPVVKTKKALEAIEAGDIIVLIERPEGQQNVQRYAESQGCTVNVEEKDGLFYIHIHKEKTESADSPRQSGDVVFITTDVLGTGDRKLGTILMKAFLNTLWDASPKPAKLMFLNSAVNLTTEGSEVIDTLRLLEKEGVEIFSCGTCLEFYGLSDKLEIGKATNMFETVDGLLRAGKVIKI
ncbi:MAG: sulfurtransferase-like selenium metabolism protein YedF [Dehalococcoidia bacterium]|jgi:selenium metabolism protein YedF